MIEGKKLAVVVPAYNEETQIERVIRTMPAAVDLIIVVDDCSTDGTVQKVEALEAETPKLRLLRHEVNQGVGGAITAGYDIAKDQRMDVTVVMAGDGQMDPADLPAVAGPVARGEVDYCKGNRLFTGEAYQKIPKIRYFGNAVLSLLTKIASGYWHIADSQTGYTAINLRMLELINWNHSYKRYGCPNDYLVRLNIYDARVRDVPISPVYGIGEKSGIRLHAVIPRMSWLLFRLFVKRMFQKYVIRDFHPLVLFYGAGIVTMSAFVILCLRLLVMYFRTDLILPINALACGFLLVSSVQFTLFAMFFDMESNKHLR